MNGHLNGSSRANGRWPIQRFERCRRAWLGVLQKKSSGSQYFASILRGGNLTILNNLHRLFSKEAEPARSDLASDTAAREATQAINNVVSIAGDVGQGGPSSTKIEAVKAGVRPNGRSGRVRTRLLPEGEEDTSYSPPEGSDRPRGGRVRRPVGWLVVIEGPGTGDWFALENGLTHLGRGADQDVSLDFGDQSISRQNHAFITYDIARHRFQLSHGESKNRTRLNGDVVENRVALTHGDCISIGKTTLRIAVFCDDQFSWPPIIDKGGSS